jgi:hypothetical protein
MDKERSRYSAMLQECARSIPGCVVANKYTGRDFPYRWEFQSNDPLAFLGALQLDGPDILQMQVMSEEDQRLFLLSKFQDALAEYHRVPQAGILGPGKDRSSFRPRTDA